MAKDLHLHLDPQELRVVKAHFHQVAARVAEARLHLAPPISEAQAYRADVALFQAEEVLAVLHDWLLPARQIRRVELHTPDTSAEDSPRPELADP